MEVRAYPKVNIGLYIGTKRPDGYHTLSSIFQKVHSVYDAVSVSFKEDSETAIEVEGLEKYAPQDKTTCYRAAMEFLNAASLTGRVRISVEKHIPVQSGLGGGSSDGAAVIEALRALTGVCLSEKQMLDISLAVGSDVPFFTSGCEAAFVSGRGEIVVPVEARKDLEFELLFPGSLKVSTPQAYSQLDRLGIRKALPSKEDLVRMYRLPVKDWAFENDFEKVNQRPETEVCKGEKLYLSGSGSSWFKVRQLTCL